MTPSANDWIRLLRALEAVSLDWWIGLGFEGNLTMYNTLFVDQAQVQGVNAAELLQVHNTDWSMAARILARKLYIDPFNYRGVCLPREIPWKLSAFRGGRCALRIDRFVQEVLP